MKHSIITVVSVIAMLVLAPAVWATDFELTGDQHLDVTTSYTNGTLYNSSTADVFESGYIVDAFLYNTGTMGIFGGMAGSVQAYDNSRINFYDGTILEWISAGGYSSVSISGGTVQHLYVDDLLQNGSERLNISGGTVITLTASIALMGNEHLDYTGTVSDLAAYGIQAADGTVNQVWLDSKTYDTSSVNISNGNVGSLVAYDNSNVEMSDGSVANHLSAWNNSSVNISGGSVFSLYVPQNSIVNIAGGSVQTIIVQATGHVNLSGGRVGFQNTGDSGEINLFEDSAVNISGGQAKNIYADDNATVNISGGGVFGYPGGYLRAYGTSNVNISNGEVWWLNTNNDSIAEISGGLTQSIITKNSSNVTITDGEVWSLTAYDTSRVDVSGGDIIGFNGLRTYDSSSVNISGGNITGQYGNSNGLRTYNSSSVTIAGGKINKVEVFDSSTVIVNGYDFELGEGLLWDSGSPKVVGTGVLRGKWFDQTSWTMEITGNQDTATILLISRPAITPDLTGDGFVNFEDFVFFARRWLDDCGEFNNWCDIVDFDLSGKIELNDLVIFSDNWLKNLVAVPDVAGLSQAAAEMAITNAELVVGTLTEQYSYTVAAGYIVRQTPWAGKIVPKNIPVDIVVSAGEGPSGMVWVPIYDPGISGYEGFNGQMSKYETTNAQYCQYLNAANASNQITVYNNTVYATSDFGHSQPYYNLAGSGYTGDGAINGGAARINYIGNFFVVDSGFENHPVTYISWYGATAFCNYYGWRLPTEREWQAIADYDGSYTYAHGAGTLNNELANYSGSIHPDGTTTVGAYGTIHGYEVADMAGNVWEWTSSCFYSDCRDGSRVCCGGGWSNATSYCTVSTMSFGTPDFTHYLLGFRTCY